MSRPTDTERGARMAVEIAYRRCLQHPLFPEPLDYHFWFDVREAAEEQIAECAALRAAQS